MGETAQRLVGLLLDGPEPAALELCVGLEKWTREDLALLLEESVELVRVRAEEGREPKKALALAARLEEVRRGLDFHLGPGHAMGWLCAGSF